MSTLFVPRNIRAASDALGQAVKYAVQVVGAVEKIFSILKMVAKHRDVGSILRVTRVDVV